MSGQATGLVLPDECGLDWAASAHESFVQLARAEPCRIDVAAVRRITTPAIQLVMALARAVAERGNRLEIAGSSPAFDRALADLGLTTFFEQWSLRTHG